MKVLHSSIHLNKHLVLQITKKQPAAGKEVCSQTSQLSLQLTTRETSPKQRQQGSDALLALGSNCVSGYIIKQQLFGTLRQRFF